MQSLAEKHQLVRLIDVRQTVPYNEQRQLSKSKVTDMAKTFRVSNPNDIQHMIICSVPTVEDLQRAKNLQFYDFELIAFSFCSNGNSKRN